MNKSLAIKMPMLFALICSIVLGKEDVILRSLTEELKRSYEALSRAKPVPIYFLQYEAWDEYQINISASLGAISFERNERHCYLDVDVRVGSPKLDNTHEIRGAEFDYTDWLPSMVEVPVDSNGDAFKAILWSETDRRFKSAQERYTKVLTEKQVKVAETDTSPDFSTTQRVAYSSEGKEIKLDLSSWRSGLCQLSSIFKKYPWIYNSEVSVRATLLTKYLVNSDGTKIRDNYIRYNIRIYGATMADDGMELYLSYPFYTTNPEGLPSNDEIATQIGILISNLDALRKAPLVEPYSGPAILMNKASGVFFHEIFGHRIEGHRQKSEHEGQTFTKKVGEKILPEFISIYDDPTMATFNNKDLNGYYRFDDEGIPAQRVVVVENGILKDFLMSRSPIERFPKSNGHGRRQYGRRVVSRQGVLYIKSTNEIPFKELRNTLLEECKRQNKPYGLIFYDIAGGFTSTGRMGTQTFKVIPLFVKRVYVDGKPDEVVRGVDIVGTPLLSFSKITLTANDYDIFNGTCGAESGMVPVSSISPSILVSEIEVEKKAKGQERPPILPAPYSGPK